MTLPKSARMLLGLTTLRLDRAGPQAASMERRVAGPKRGRLNIERSVTDQVLLGSRVSVFLLTSAAAGSYGRLTKDGGGSAIPGRPTRRAFRSAAGETGVGWPLNLGNDVPRVNLANAGFCSGVREDMAKLRGAGPAARARNTEGGARADFGKTVRVKDGIASLCSGARGGMDTLCSTAAEATVGRRCKVAPGRNGNNRERDPGRARSLRWHRLMLISCPAIAGTARNTDSAGATNLIGS